jgi:hypothetical protein
MDPFSVLGVAASVISCVQLTGALLKRVGPSGHSKKNLHHILKVVCGFRGAYDGLKSLLEFNEEDHSRLTALQHLEEPLRDCKRALQVLEDRLKNLNFVGQYMVGVLWDRKVEECLQRLEDGKELLELALHVDHQ